MEAGSLGV
jgi:hypothetical protein